MGYLILVPHADDWPVEVVSFEGSASRMVDRWHRNFRRTFEREPRGYTWKVSEADNMVGAMIESRKLARGQA